VAALSDLSQKADKIAGSNMAIAGAAPAADRIALILIESGQSSELPRRIGAHLACLNALIANVGFQCLPADKDILKSGSKSQQQFGILGDYANYPEEVSQALKSLCKYMKLVSLRPRLFPCFPVRDRPVACFDR
jgi:hypothetical protein